MTLRALLLILIVGAHAAGATTPMAVGGFELSRDTDGFRSEFYSAGAGVYLSETNRIDRIGYSRTEGHYSVAGFATHSSADSLFFGKGFGVEADIQLTGEVTAAHLDTDRDRQLGWLQLSGHPNNDSNAELRYEKSWVDSRNGLAAGVTSTAITAAGDYQLTDRFNLAGVVGRVDYSDDNERILQRAKANWLLLEEYGVSLYARGRHYTDSEPRTGNYFSPETYSEYLGGISVRRRFAWLHGSLFAAADWGRQIADGDTAPARTWQLRLESFPRQRLTYALTTGFNATAGAGGGDDYQYRYTTASVSWAY